ncbi:MAG: AAA family ATPase [Gemmatimonadaceae bacterium]
MPATDSDPSLELRTLGAAALYAQPGNHLLLAAGKPLALLAYLALAPGRQCSRESLIDLLWSDLDQERARRALRQTLFNLRRVVGDDAIAGAEELRLATAIRSDRDDFLSALECGELERAVASYGGDFLPAFGVPGGVAFEQWADLERERLRSGFLRGGELLVRRHLNASRFREARELARRIRALVPDSEAGARLALETAIAARDFVTASMEAEAIEQWAANGRAPLEAATRAALARARRVAPAGDDDRAATTLTAELTGREREFFAITAAWDAVRAGPARHVHLTAPAGFGKSRLLRDALARLTAAGATVISLRGAPGDRDVPYAFAGDLATALARLPGALGIAPASASTLLALTPTLSTTLSGVPDAAAGEEALRRRILALSDLVHSVADEQRFVLAIDDLHWIDAWSYRVLEGMWGRLEGAHVLCLTASRPERAPSSDRCTMLPLRALTTTEVGALVGAIASIPPAAPWGEALVEGLHRASGGSPLLILETLRLALDRGTLALAQQEWRCDDTAGLAALLREGEALRERVRTLPAAHLWTLALIATAGMPLERNALATLLTVAREETGDQLDPLERLGLVSRVAGGWIPAHDEIAEAARAALDPSTRARAERVVAGYCEQVAGDDPHAVLRSAHHARAAADDAALRRLYRRYVRLLRTRGDRRPLDVLARELLGDAIPNGGPESLAASLPLAWRLGLWNGARQALAAGALLLAVIAGAAGVAYQRARSAGDRSLQRLAYADSAGATYLTVVHPNEWDGRATPVEFTRHVADLAPVATRYSERPPVFSPDGRAVAWTQHSGDSTTLDIWIRTPAGTRRLTRERRDDVVTGWLPDGSALVGLTNRWSPPDDGDYDVAVFDTATGAARQVTRGPSHDNAAVSSPDGTRIAFVRESSDFPGRLCVTSFGGTDEPPCRSVEDAPAGELVGWSGLNEVVVIADHGDRRLLVAYDWERRTTRLVLGPWVTRARMSPDRSWVVASVRVDGIRGVRDWVVPVARPSAARPVSPIVAPSWTVRWWLGTGDSSSRIDRLEFADTSHSLPLGVSSQLLVRAVSANGSTIPLLAPVRWQSSDTTVAVVDSGGIVRPRRRGRVTISASLAGWRSTARPFAIAGQPPVTLVREGWDASWESRWIVFGDPRPRVVTGPGAVRALWNAGDGVYTSAVVLRQAFDAREGLGVELRLSTPLTRPKWQRARTFFDAGVDIAALVAADPRNVASTLGTAEAQCGFEYPMSGAWGATHGSARGGVGRILALGDDAASMRTGRWWTLRVQLLPDGRCGIALNGRVLWISPEPIPLDRPFHLHLGDESAGTQLLHGPLELWRGVRTDVAWMTPR